MCGDTNVMIGQQKQPKVGETLTQQSEKREVKSVQNTNKSSVKK